MLPHNNPTRQMQVQVNTMAFKNARQGPADVRTRHLFQFFNLLFSAVLYFYRSNKMLGFLHLRERFYTVHAEARSASSQLPSVIRLSTVAIRCRPIIAIRWHHIIYFKCYRHRLPSLSPPVESDSLRSREIFDDSACRNIDTRHTT